MNAHSCPACPTRHAVVTGIGGPAGAGAAGMLRTAGYRVTGVDMREVAHQVDEFVRMPPVEDPAFVPRLMRLMTEGTASWLVPTVAEELPLVAALAPQLRSRGVAIFMPGPAQTAICADKWRTVQQLERCGVTVPASAIGHPHAPAVRALGTPILSKPRFGRGGRGVTVHDTPPLEAPDADLLWQHFLPGTEYDVVLLCDARRPGDPDLCVVLEKLELREGRTGNAVRVDRVESSHVAETACAAASSLGLDGPLDIDIRLDAGGRAHVLEINTRIGAHCTAVPELITALIARHAQGALGG